MGVTSLIQSGALFRNKRTNGFDCRIALTLTSNSALLPSTQTDFPVLISLTHNVFRSVVYGGRVKTSTSGVPNDVVFCADNELLFPLNFEIFYWNAVTGAILAWVKIPSCALGTIFYAGVGKAALISFQGNVNGTWNSAYKGAWNLGDGSSLSLADSTSNGNTLTNANVVAAAGPFGGGGSFNGSNATLSLGSAPVAAVPLTFEAWINTSATAVTMSILYTGGGSLAWNGWFIQQSGTNAEAVAVSATVFGTSSLAASLNSWHLIMGVMTTNSSRVVYVDGVAGTPETSSLTPAFTPNGLTIGASNHQGVTDNFMTGSLAFPRISNVARSADWAKALFSNQGDPASFMSAAFSVAA